MANEDLTRAHIDFTVAQLGQLEQLAVALSSRTRNETIRRAIAIAQPVACHVGRVLLESPDGSVRELVVS